MLRKNPCLSCGACCAHFRVSFYWAEIDSEVNGTVPAEMTDDISPFFRAMKGTNHKNPRCIALEGEIGQQAGCKIYAKRSSSCADFGIHWENGSIRISRADLIRCNQARKAHGLTEITYQTTRFIIQRPKMTHIVHMLSGFHPVHKKQHKSL